LLDLCSYKSGVTPPTGHSAAPWTTTTPVSIPSCHPEAPRAQHRSSTPRHRPNFLKEPSTVSRSAVGIPHRHCILIHLNPLVTSAGSSPTDPRIQGTSSLYAAAFPTSAACSAAWTSSLTIFRCSSGHHETWVSFPPFLGRFCARCCRSLALS
jgi:hypothetical protein